MVTYLGAALELTAAEIDPAIFDGSGQITEPYQLIGVPTIIIADNKGVIQYRNFATPEITEEHFSRLNAN